MWLIALAIIVLHGDKTHNKICECHNAGVLHAGCPHVRVQAVGSAARERARPWPRHLSPLCAPDIFHKLNTTSATPKMQSIPDARSQSFEELYGPPENFLEIEVRTAELVTSTHQPGSLCRVHRFAIQ